MISFTGIDAYIMILEFIFVGILIGYIIRYFEGNKKYIKPSKDKVKKEVIKKEYIKAEVGFIVSVVAFLFGMLMGWLIWS